MIKKKSFKKHLQRVRMKHRTLAALEQWVYVGSGVIHRLYATIPERMTIFFSLSLTLSLFRPRLISFIPFIHHVAFNASLIDWRSNLILFLLIAVYCVWKYKIRLGFFFLGAVGISFLFNCYMGFGARLIDRAINNVLLLLWAWSSILYCTFIE